MSAYYNEFDPKAAATLRELISKGHIAPGDVDERSIEDVTPDELLGYTQVHLFAGFGLWSLAFRWAGIADDEPAWSCSCPCQPFSAAGKGAGFADERHLWPAAFHLISNAKRPDVPLYGEQVASSRVMPWIDLVWNDMEGTGHTFRPIVLASAGFGAPIIRQRTYWVACADREFNDRSRVTRQERRSKSSDRREHGGLVRPFDPRLQGHSGHGYGGSESRRLCEIETGPASTAGQFGGMELSSGERRYGGEGISSRLLDDGTDAGREQGDTGPFGNDKAGVSRDRWPGPTNGFWGTPDWLRCRDDLWRPVEGGTFPLAHGDFERVGRLRGYGNAISPQVAAHFIRAHREAVGEEKA